MPIPRKFAEAPDVPMGLDLYLTAFWELTTCRQPGFSGPGPIPWAEIAGYAVAMGLDERQFDDLVYYIRVLDVAYLEHRAKAAKGKK